MRTFHKNPVFSYACSALKQQVLPILFILLLACPFILFGAVEQRPNVLLIMADDLGFSDLGCYGGEIKTPNLDRLAAKGIRFTQFYNTARCWPTRAALLTGFYAQQVRRDKIPGIPSGGRGVRQPWARLLPDLLKSSGYRSYHSGKWHLDGMPLENGFDRSYYLKDQGRYFNPKVHWKDDVKLSPVEKDSGYFITKAIADHAIECLKEHEEKHTDKPFFHYLAFTAPHFPLHALPEDVERYRETYQEGWESIRQKRWNRIQQMGLLKNGKLSQVEPDLGPPYHFPDHLKILGENEVNRPLLWNELTDGQKMFQAEKMALHAAMIDRMDQEIGRVLQQLRNMNALDNTLILFLSDNGASAEIMVRDDGHDPEAIPGSAATYLCLGPGWSTTCNTPFRRHKTWVHEGGISTPLIMSWPKGIKSQGELRTNPGHVTDIVPTLLDVTGTTAPKMWDAHKVPQTPGASLLPVVYQDHSVKHNYFWWFHDGHRALRMGDWKVVASKNEPWELYDLSTDRAEEVNLSNANPQLTSRLKAEWNNRMEEFRQLAMRNLTQKGK